MSGAGQRTCAFFVGKGVGSELQRQQRTYTMPETLSKQEPPRGAFKLKAAAEYLGGLSIATMHRLIQRGLLRPNRSLRHIILSREECDRFLRNGQ